MPKFPRCCWLIRREPVIEAHGPVEHSRPADIFTHQQERQWQLRGRNVFVVSHVWDWGHTRQKDSVFPQMTAQCDAGEQKDTCTKFSFSTRRQWNRNLKPPSNENNWIFAPVKKAKLSFSACRLSWIHMAGLPTTASKNVFWHKRKVPKEPILATCVC